MGERLLCAVDAHERPPLYEPLSVSFTETDVVEAMRLYLEFLALPEDVKQKFHYFDESTSRTSEAGYMRRKKEDSDKPTGDDDKFVFHHTPALMRSVEGIQRIHYPAAANAFLDVADELYHQTADAVKEKFVEWSEDSPWLAGAHFPTNGQDMMHHMRFLGYLNGNARGHYDKAVATAAIAQSKNGLRIGEGEEDLELVQRGNFEPIIFPGYGWNQLHEMLGQTTSKRAAWHDTIDVPEYAETGHGDLLKEIKELGSEALDVMRIVIVDFINPTNIYLNSTLEQTHTPIRWRNMRNKAIPMDGGKSLIAA